MFSKRGDYFAKEMSRERKKRHHGDATQLAKAASRPGCDGPTPMAGKRDRNPTSGAQKSDS